MGTPRPKIREFDITTRGKLEHAVLVPANQCSTLPCSGGVQLSIPYAGPNVPFGNRAVSSLTFVMCTF